MLRGLLSILAARYVQHSGRMTVLHCIYAKCSSLCSMPLPPYTAIFMCQLGDTRQLIRTSRSRRLRISKYHEQVTETLLEVYVVRGNSVLCRCVTVRWVAPTPLPSQFLGSHEQLGHLKTYLIMCKVYTSIFTLYSGIRGTRGCDRAATQEKSTKRANTQFQRQLRGAKLYQI